MKADAMTLGQRIRHGWNAFLGREQQIIQQQDLGPAFYSRPDRNRYRFGNERSILASIYTRIAIDVSNYVKFQHIKMDDDGRFLENVNSGLNYCLNTEANLDQAARVFRQDIVKTMLNDGVAAIVPINTTYNPRLTGSYDIQTMRVGKVVEWYPQHVKIDLYNDLTGQHQDITLPKDMVGLPENPLYDVMNEPISTLKRLIYKLNLLDSVDEQSSSGKLDLIIQLPYTIKTELRRQEAEKRRRDIETQLTGNRYGIAYTDGTEKVTQLNRSVENKLLDQIDGLTSMLYSQLGMTKEVFDGTADERVMLNYINRTIEPFAATIAEELNRKFLTKTARTQHQQVTYFYDIFKFATLETIANNGSQMVSSEIVTRNEVRQKLGFKPVDDPAADQLINPNINPHGDASMPMDQSEAQGVNAESGGGPTLADMKVSEIPENT
jgi:hypothetical protein